jgi:signal transduction histidine kinase
MDHNETEFEQRGLAGRKRTSSEGGSLHAGCGTAGALIAGGAGDVSRIHEPAAQRVVAEGWRNLKRLGQVAAGSAAVLVPVPLHATRYDAPQVRTALETMILLTALAAGWLLRVQFAHSRRLRDLLLFGATSVLGLTCLCLSALPAALNIHAGVQFPASQLWGQLFVGAMFAATGFAPADRLVTRPRRAVAMTAGLSLVAVAAAAAGGLLFGAQVLGGTSQSMRGAFGPFGHPLGLLLVLGAAGLLASAAGAFTRRHSVQADRGARLLAGATVMLAGASYYHVVPVSLSPGQVSLSVLLPTVALALILAAAVRQELQARALLATAAALAERRRVAQDLHDGLAQDLACIAAHGPRMAQEMGAAQPVVMAAKHALAISRRTISALLDPAGATASESLEAVAHELRNRFDIAIAVDADPDDDRWPYAREDVTRITREAIVNAARHGGARNVLVSLRRADHGLALKVVDDGCGYAAASRTAGPNSFGLRNMQERAISLGGHLTVRQPRRGGTELEVLVP